MRKQIDLKVHIAFDPDALVWYVSESDIPGLRLEAADPATLMQRIVACMGEMIELNEDEILGKHADRDRPRVGITPVFDSLMPVPAYA